MTRIPIDTLRLSARLKKEGLAAEQADALARALGDELGRNRAPGPDPGTPSDLEDPVQRARLTTEIRMFKWVFGFAILVTLTAFVALFESLDGVRENQSRNNAQLAALEARMLERFNGVDQQFKSVDQQFKSVDQQFESVDQQFKAVDRQLDLIVQRVGSVEALVRELISMQRVAAAAGAGATVGGPLAGGEVRTDPAGRAPEGVMR